MTSALSQSLSDPPTTTPGTTALHIDPALGPAVLMHDLGVATDPLYHRFMVNPSGASGGEITVAGGIDTAGDAAWRLVLDTDSATICLKVGNAQCAAELPPALAWHCVEAGLDAAASSATLRVDGVERDSLTAAYNATRYAWLGGAFPGPGMSGTIQLDDWVLASTPIGAPRSLPELDHAGDARRWLVVYNTRTPDSVAWAEAYRARRGVPYANLCGLDLPTTESITPAEYEMLRQQLSAYLDGNHLRDQVVGVLLGFGVPGYADLAGQGTLTPIAAYLHTDDAHGLPVVNPLHQDPITARPAAGDFAAARLTGRIDAGTLADALALLDRADVITAQPLAHDQPADVLIDINPDNPNIGPVYTEPVAEWAGGEGLARLRLPSTVFDTAGPASASGESVVWGWRDAAPPAGFFAEPAGRRALCMQLDPEPQPAVSARTPSATDWLSTAIQAGYAAAAAPSRAYSLSSMPMPRLFFEALRSGWTLAEAWMVAQPFLRDGLQIIGDPLMTIGFPKAGYDVFGPANRLDQIDFTQPLAVLHAGERSYPLDPGDAPPPGAPKRYSVRRYDEQGRPDHADRVVVAGLDQGMVYRPAAPAWPHDAGWPPAERNGRLVLTAVWPASLRTLGIDTVHLQAQAESADPVLIDRQTPAVGVSRAVFEADPPAECTRYRFVVVQGSADLASPWSRWVEPADEPTAELSLLEPQP